jgi:hypothetical protein
MKRYKIRKEQLERVVESFVMENTKKGTITEKEELNEMDPMYVDMLTGLGGAAGIFALAAIMSKLTEKAAKGDFGPKGEKLAKDLEAIGDAAASAKRGPSGGYRDDMNEEELNEIDPITTAVAGVSGIFALAAIMTKLTEKAKKGDFGPKGEKLAKNLEAIGDAAAKAKRGPN